ncbi:hypothetical protein [Agrobacterium tumefaciens]|uniref:hypothetical protein n=1 Tax=Agrobacterium tumefaciens TaxID=358 RepID=UPI0016595FEE|nr:hypothetical protein [Agrobacterium tumefaciens]QNP80996.1 hypothetical protein IAI05_07090 [Agrobacterium tumefaciens]
MMLAYPRLPEPHRSFFTTEEAYKRAVANYREHEARRQRSDSIDLYMHATIAVAIFSAIAFMIWQMVAAYIRAYPAI